MRVGVISDTHGMLRKGVLEHFKGVSHILHAGDVGPASILTELEKIAPVKAVWGNTDDTSIRALLPEVAEFPLAGKAIVVVHGHRVRPLTPVKLCDAYPKADIIIYGHTHIYGPELVGRTLVLNPGSAKEPRSSDGKPCHPSVAILTLGSEPPTVERIDLVEP